MDSVRKYHKVIGRVHPEAAGDKTGAEWGIRIIDAGLSLNDRPYPIDVLHRDKDVFEGVPVYAGDGPDHSFLQRGVRAIAGYVKDVRAVSADESDPGGLGGTFHLSDPNLRALFMDLHSEGKLDEFVGFSIVARGLWGVNEETGEETLISLESADSVDLVREPAAGGRFIDVTESYKGSTQMSDKSTDKDGDTKVEEGTPQTITLSDEQLDKLMEGAVDKLAPAVATLLKEKAGPDDEDEAGSDDSDAGDDADSDDEEGDAEESGAHGRKKGVKTSSEAVVDPQVIKDLREATLRLNRARVAEMVKEAKLPEVAGAHIFKLFQNEVRLDEAKVQEEIDGQRAYIASLTETESEKVTESVGRITVDSREKVLARIDAIFESDERFTVGEGDSATKVTAYRSFREAISDLTGQKYQDISGRAIHSGWFSQTENYDPDEAERRGDDFIKEALETSTWGEVMADRMHKALVRHYDSFPQYANWRRVALSVPIEDFQTHRRIKLGSYVDLPVVAERGTYGAAGNPTDEETTLSVSKRGMIADQITREALFNDNVGAIATIPRRLAIAAARTLHKAVFVDIFASNATYTTDSTALFDATHSNTGTTALSISGANATDLAMRDQTNVDGNDILGATNQLFGLIVPNELKALATRIARPTEALITRLDADTDADIDPRQFVGQIQEVIVVDEFTDTTEYFGFANPALAPGLEVGFLEGREEPALFFQREESGGGFSQDVQNIKIRHEYGVSIKDYRPFYRQT